MTEGQRRHDSHSGGHTRPMDVLTALDTAPTFPIEKKAVRHAGCDLLTLCLLAGLPPDTFS